MSPSTVNREDVFDVIIAGAGPAGCVLASRLAEEPDKRVLLIEAGPDVGEHPDVLDPFCVTASSNVAFHWPGLLAEFGAKGNGEPARAATPYVQGYGVGGASNINGMGTDRGQPSDYDEWHTRGATGWRWSDVLPYFNKLERDLDFSTSGIHPMHGTSGPIPVQRIPRPRWAPFTTALADALQRRGFPYIEDYNADFRDGFSPVPMNCAHNQRVSAATGYLTREVRRRPNLEILANTNVDRIEIEGGRASGVVVRANGEQSLLRAREVIVACGAIQSPALLMRSGIGPQEQLRRNGIEVIRDLPGVGANLLNHPHVTLTFYLPKAAAQARDNPFFLQNWLRFSSKHPDCPSGDMHLMAFNKCAWHRLGGRVGAAVLSVLKSYSRGRIELSSKDPAISPRVHFNALADRRDHARLVSGLRFVLELLTDHRVAAMRRQIFMPNARLVASMRARTPWNAFKAAAITSVLDRAPLRRLLLKSSSIDPAKLLADDRVLDEFVQRQTQVQYHVCGTCRMGRDSDRDAVVDAAGRVHGIASLRVVDASIFPTIPRGYTHFIVLMAAEKLADAVRADWRLDARGIGSAGVGSESSSDHSVCALEP
jgi:5-(hydroxymethyl)furfural/furfural oxidase